MTQKWTGQAEQSWEERKRDRKENAETVQFEAEDGAAGTTGWSEGRQMNVA